MFDFNEAPFGSTVRIPPEAQVIFVSDMFVKDYVGGAELTSQALIDSSPFNVFELHTRDVTMELLKSGVDKFWVFGNFSELNFQLLPSIVGNLRYTVLEYDYKYCKYRSPEKHMSTTGMPCDCHNQMNGKIISAFLHGSMGLWWMSEKQKERYHTLFPFLMKNDNVVLSSVFDDKTLGLIKVLRESRKASQIPQTKWLVLGSNSWIKGAPAAKKWCEDGKLDHEVVWNVPYEQLLQKMSEAEGFVYLPPGGDTCPRMVIEAKLLGCKLHLNDNVQHKDEEWFATDDIQAIEEYLYTARKLFWNAVKKMSEYKPSISGYTTTKDCIKQGYPYVQCIKSMLQFCDEVVVLDGGSTDGTYQELTKLAAEDQRLKVSVRNCDWTHPRHAVFDGMQKAAARAMCTKEFCWQMDCDEIVHETDAPKVSELVRVLPKDVHVLSLPVIEYWCGQDKVRADIQPWKWRLSRNLPNVTHGIPVTLRRTDTNGDMYAAPGTDGCDMIDKETGEPMPHVSFYTEEIDNMRRAGLNGNFQALKEYERWYNTVTNDLPGVFHYSWYDMSRKIKLYRDYWQNHWNGLYDKNVSDTAENNMFFDVPWAQVTDEMIETRSKELAQTGGHIWHSKWKGQRTPWITSNRTQPKVMS